MAKNKVLVFIIRGVGQNTFQGADTLSTELHRLMQKRKFDSRFGIDPSSDVVYYSCKWRTDLDSEQDNALAQYAKEYSSGMWGSLREAMITHAGDALAYQRPGRATEIQNMVMEQLASAIEEEGGSDNLKVILVGHSLGSVIAYHCMLRYASATFDAASRPPISSVVTIGSPLPTFISCLKTRPLPEFQVLHPEFKWWNIWSKNDIISLPYKPFFDDRNNKITDMEIALGLTPMAHGDYWKDSHVLDTIVSEIGRISK